MCNSLVVSPLFCGTEWEMIKPLFKFGLEGNFDFVLLDRFKDLKNCDYYDFLFLIGQPLEGESDLVKKLKEFKVIFADFRYYDFLAFGKTKKFQALCRNGLSHEAKFVNVVDLGNLKILSYFKPYKSKKVINIGKINNFYFFQPANFLIFPYQDCSYYKQSLFFFEIFKSYGLYDFNSKKWEGNSFAVSIRDDDLHPYLTDMEIANHQEILEYLIEHNFKISIAAIPLGAQIILPKNYKGVDKNLNDLFLKIMMPLRECMGSLVKKSKIIKFLVRKIYVDWQTREKNSTFVKIKNSQGVLNGYSLRWLPAKKQMKINGQLIKLGEKFYLKISNLKMQFCFDSVDSLENPSKAFFGFLGSLSCQYDNNYLERIKLLVLEGKVAISLHGVTHHQKRLVKGEGSEGFCEFYAEGTNKPLISSRVEKLLQLGIKELKKIFGEVEYFYTDGFGHYTVETLKALKKMKIAYYPFVESTLSAPIKVEGNYILGITHIYFKRFSLVKKYLKYVKLNHGVASFAIHSILGNESVYNSYEFSKKIVRYLRDENYLSVFPSEILEKIKVQDNLTSE